MQASVYILLFNDPELKKLAPSTLEIGTYTTAPGLKQPHTRLDYLPLKASLITSSLGHPKKAKRVSIYSSRNNMSAQSTKQVVTVPD